MRSTHNEVPVEGEVTGRRGEVTDRTGEVCCQQGLTEFL